MGRPVAQLRFVLVEPERDDPFERGILLVQAGQFKHAEKYLRDAIAMQPDDGKRYTWLARCLFCLRRDKEALAIARDGVARAPNESYAHYICACILSANHRQPDALAAVEKAIQLQPRWAPYWELKARIHLRRRWVPGSLAEGLRAVEEALALDPQDEDALHTYALVLSELGRKREAFNALNKALEVNPEASHVHYTVGELSFEEGNRDAAERHYMEALRLNPESQRAREAAAGMLRARHRFYRVLLLFMHPDGRARTFVLIGLIGALLTVARLGEWMPMLKPLSAALILPMFFGIFAILYLMLLGNPIFNFVVSQSSSAEMRVLSREDEVQGKLILIPLASATAFGTAGYVTPHFFLYCEIIASFLLALPVVATFDVPPGWMRKFMYCYLAVDAVLLAASAFDFDRLYLLFCISLGMSLLSLALGTVGRTVRI